MHHDSMIKRQFTAVYQKKKHCYIAWVEEIPGVNTQGKTKKEARENLQEALSLIIESNQKISTPQNQKLLFREPIEVAVHAMPMHAWTDANCFFTANTTSAFSSAKEQSTLFITIQKQAVLRPFLVIVRLITLLQRKSVKISASPRYNKQYNKNSWLFFTNTILSIDIC